jgi:hypothetical protein
MIVVMSTDDVHDVVDECDVQDVLDVLNDFDFREEYEIHINVDKYECRPDVSFAVSRERKQNITFREEGGSKVIGPTYLQNPPFILFSASNRSTPAK